jgi:hypothetical protein
LIANHDSAAMAGMLVERADGERLAVAVAPSIGATLGLHLAKMSLALMELSPAGQYAIEWELAELNRFYREVREKRGVTDDEE